MKNILKLSETLAILGFCGHSYVLMKAFDQECPSPCSSAGVPQVTTMGVLQSLNTYLININKVPTAQKHLKSLRGSALEDSRRPQTAGECLTQPSPQSQLVPSVINGSSLLLHEEMHLAWYSWLDDFHQTNHVTETHMTTTKFYPRRVIPLHTIPLTMVAVRTE